MTTALAFDLFLDEHDVLLDNKLTDHINSEMKSWSKKTTNLTVVKNNKLENEIKNHKAENEILKNKEPIIKNQNTNSIKVKNDNSKNVFYFHKANCDKNKTINSEYEINKDKVYKLKNELSINDFNFFEKELKSIRKEMIKSYMKLMSN